MNSGMGFEKILFDKIKNKENLDYNELQCIERCLVMHKIYQDLLTSQLGLLENKYNLEFVDK